MRGPSMFPSLFACLLRRVRDVKLLLEQGGKKAERPWHKVTWATSSSVCFSFFCWYPDVGVAPREVVGRPRARQWRPFGSRKRNRCFREDLGRS